MIHVDVYNQKELDNVIKEANPNVMPVVRFRGAELWGSSSAVLWDSSSAVLWDSSSAELWDSSTAELRDSSTAVLWDSSTAVLWDSSSAVLWGNAQALNRTKGSIDTHGNSRIVYDPRTISEYCDYYGIDFGDTVKLYKAVHKDADGDYHSDNTYSFTYHIGAVAIADDFTVDVSENCGHGIQMAYLDWCLNYGSVWSDLAILEVEADANSIIVPKYCDGKVRTDRVKVLREVPLEECGTYGKILARKMQGR